MQRCVPLRFACIIGLLEACLCGCAMGPTALRASRMPYNQVIQHTTNEQFLLNLVRLQYREAPLFLEVGSIAAQFTFSESANITGTLNENVGVAPLNPDVLQLGGQIAFQDNPTITFAPLQGGDFAQRPMTPVTLDTIATLARSGWSIERVMRLTVQGMNGLGNASRASGPTPDEAPAYAPFVRAAELFRDLQFKGMLQIGYEPRKTMLSEPLPAEEVTPTDAIEAAKHGYRFEPADDGRLVLTGTIEQLVWRIPPAAADTAEVSGLIELLGLVPGRECYEVRATTGEGLPAALAGKRDTLDVSKRSLLGTFFLLSRAVEVPYRHRDAGLVTTTHDEAGQPFDWTRVTGDLLRVHSQAMPPRNPAVAVRYMGWWFYVDNSDLTSKSTLALLGQLFALQAGREVAGGAPVLTLPVGG
jgi:hypothetical protein